MGPPSLQYLQFNCRHKHILGWIKTRWPDGNIHISELTHGMSYGVVARHSCVRFLSSNSGAAKIYLHNVDVCCFHSVHFIWD